MKITARSVTARSGRSGQGAGIGDDAPRHWKQDPAAVKADILQVATEEFAANGLSGSRIEDIAARTRTSKRMIYYYFGDKVGLYREVLETAYREMRESELALDTDRLDPIGALRALTEFTFRHHASSPAFIRLVMIENVHQGRHLAESTVLRSLNASAIGKLGSIYARGVDAGLFRPGIAPLELHWQISALSFFNVSNAQSFTASFGDRLYGPRGQARLRRQVVDSILRFVLRAELVRTKVGD